MLIVYEETAKIFKDGEEIPLKTKKDIDALIELDDYIVLTVMCDALIYNGNKTLINYAMTRLDNYSWHFRNMGQNAGLKGDISLINFVLNELVSKPHWEDIMFGASMGGHLEILKFAEQKALIAENTIHWRPLSYCANGEEVANYIREKMLMEDALSEDISKMLNEKRGPKTVQSIEYI